MKALLGLLVYERGQRALPADQHLVYAAITNRRIRTGTSHGVPLSTQIVEIGVRKSPGPPTQRLLGGKAINAARLFAHNIDCVHYIELCRVPSAAPLGATAFENVITRWLCIASGAWPLANQVKGNQNLETKMAYDVARHATTDQIVATLQLYSNPTVRRRLQAVRDQFRLWIGGPAQANLPHTPVAGLRQEVPVQTRAQPVALLRPTAIKLLVQRGRIGQFDTYQGIDQRLLKKVPDGKTFTILASTNNGMNVDRNTAEEDAAIVALNAI
jgi:hypothetical protein